MSSNLKHIFTENIDRIRRGGEEKKASRASVLLDLRNLYELEKVNSLGFIHDGAGRN